MAEWLSGTRDRKPAADLGPEAEIVSTDLKTRLLMLWLASLQLLYIIKLTVAGKEAYEHKKLTACLKCATKW